MRIVVIKWLIRTFLKGYSLHKNPPKGVKKPRMVNEPPEYPIPDPFEHGMTSTGTLVAAGEEPKDGSWHYTTKGE